MSLILVVDDDKIIQRILSHTLRKNGYDVEVASSGYEALSLLNNDSFDLAIFDISMPEMDGIELLQTVRQQAQDSPLPIIMLTASSQDEDRERARDAGADAFLTKPASSTDLLNTVTDLL